jgi:hypothetical protein
MSLPVLPVRPVLSRTPSRVALPTAPVTAPYNDGSTSVDAVLELSDGSAFRGISFGAEGKSVAGECVFQTGIVQKYILQRTYLKNDYSRNGWLH